MPVFGTMAARFNDDGVTALFQAILPKLKELGLKAGASRLPAVATRHSTNQTPVVPPGRVRYLADISDTVRAYKRHALAQARIARERQSLAEARRMLAAECKEENANLQALGSDRDGKLDSRSRKLLEMWPKMRDSYGGDEYVVKIRDREVRTALTHTTLSGSKIRKVALPHFEDHGELLKWLLLEKGPTPATSSMGAVGGHRVTIRAILRRILNTFILRRSRIAGCES